MKVDIDKAPLECDVGWRRRRHRAAVNTVMGGERRMRVCCCWDRGFDDTMEHRLTDRITARGEEKDRLTKRNWAIQGRRRDTLSLGEKRNGVGGQKNKQRQRQLGPWRGGGEKDTDADCRQRRSDAAATMRPYCWVMVALAGFMSYFSPERVLGAPQREGERRRRRDIVNSCQWCWMRKGGDRGEEGKDAVSNKKACVHRG